MGIPLKLTLCSLSVKGDAPSIPGAGLSVAAGGGIHASVTTPCQSPGLRTMEPAPAAIPRLHSESTLVAHGWPAQPFLNQE